MSEEDKPVILDPDMPSEEIRKFYEFCDRRLIGQPRVKHALGRALENYSSPYRDHTRPICFDMYAGPSGAGKTLTAEVLAEYLFGSPNALLKISCQTFDDRWEISRLIGSAPGLVGFNENADPKRSFPLLSWWNIYRYDYENRFLHSVEEDSEKEEEKNEEEGGVSSGELDMAHQRMMFAQLMEKRLEKRFATLLKMNEYYENDVQWALAQIKKLEEGKNGGSATEISKKLKEMRKDQNLFEGKRQKVALLTRHFFDQLAELYWTERDVFKEFGQLFAKASKQAARAALIKKAPDFEDVKYGLTGIILFDEIEKAHPSFPDQLLEIVEKGRVQLADGQEVDLSNAFIFATSNIGEKAIANLINPHGVAGYTAHEKKSGEELADYVYDVASKEYRETFSTPFRGRVEEFEVFRPLSDNAIVKIVHQQLLLFKKEIFPVVLQVDPAVIDFIAKEASDRPELQARLIKNKLRKYIRAPLIRLMNRGDVVKLDAVAVKLRPHPARPEKSEIFFERIQRAGALTNGEKKVWLALQRKKIEEEWDDLFKDGS